MSSALAAVNHFSDAITGLAAATPTPTPTPTPGPGGIPSTVDVPVINQGNVKKALGLILALALMWLAVKMGFRADRAKPKEQLEKIASGVLAVLTGVLALSIGVIALWGQQILAFFGNAS